MKPTHLLWILLPAILFEIPLALPCRAADVPASTPPPKSSALNPAAERAAKGGVERCLPRLSQLADFVTAKSRNAAHLFLPTEKPDERPVSVSFEIDTSGASATYASVTAAPGVGEACAGLYEAVVYWPKSCLEVAMNHFASTTSKGPLLKNIQVLEGGDTMRVFLIEAGEGCISIKKEVVY